LAHEGRHGVRGVAGEQHAARAHRPREPGPELVHRAPHEHAVGRREPRREQRPNTLLVREVLGAFARQQHELEAAVPPAVAGVHVRPHRIAPLAGRRQPGERLHVVRPDVDDEPALREALSSKATPAAWRTSTDTI
jgi:hypothetical protein